VLGSCTKVCWARAVGAYLKQDRIVLTEVANTPAGMVVLGRHTQEIGEDGPGEALKQWLTTHLTPRQRRHTPVCVGVAPEHAFFATRRLDIQRRKGPPSANELLEASGAFHAWDKDDAAADYVKTKLPGVQAYSLTAVRREVAEQVLSGLKAAGVRSSRLEPAPWSLLRAADRQGKPPKKWKLTIRVLLDETNGLAMLVAGEHPVLWRRFAIHEADPALSITSAVRALQIYARQNFDVRSFPGIFIQGRISDGLVKRMEDETGMTVAAAGGDGPTDGQYSLALALSAKKSKDHVLDLMRSLRPPPSIREMFPWKLAVTILLLTGCMGFVLWDESASLACELESVQRQNASHVWARSLSTPAIRTERQVLSAEVGAVRRFLATRIVWSNYLRDLPTRLPPNACLSKIWATCEMPDMSKKKQKRDAKQSLTLSGMARFADRTRAPREIDAFLESLREMKLLKHDFPLVEMAEIRWRKQGQSEIALFTIVALPKKSKK